MKRIITLFVTTAVLASCGGGEKKGTEDLAKLKNDRAALDEKIKKLESKTIDTNKQVTAVSVIEVQPQPFRGFVEVQSQITGDEDVNAAPQAAGTVTQILVSPGQRVSKGQLLATLDAASVEQQIKSQEATLGFAKTVYEKQQRLWAQQIGTELQLLQAKSTYEAAVKQREATIAQRNMYRIISPISGVIDAVNIKIGGTASPIIDCIHVVNTNKLKAEASLGESYLGKVKVGDDVTLLFPDINDSIKAKLTYVAQAVDPISRAFNVQIRLGSNSKLHPNMSCRMKINNYTNSNVITVPVSVVQNLNQGDVVYVANGNKAKAVVVTVGRNSNGIVEILSGLNPGDRVITEGYDDLDDGEDIQVK